METKYYSIWDLRTNKWTTGYRRINGLLQCGNDQCPWICTRQEVEQWVQNDWLGNLAGYKQEIREISAEDAERYKAKRIALDEEFRLQQIKRAEALRLAELKRLDDRRRAQHAEKYL